MSLPRGFTATGIAAGLKPSGKPDLGLLVSDRPATAAAVFTKNKVKAAPVVVTQEHIATGVARAIVVNAGNANACTGAQGLTDARDTASDVAASLGIDDVRHVLVASTGVIGVPMPMENMRKAIPDATAAVSPDGLERLATAIMTTDTVPKVATAEMDGARIVGVAKGAGMIAPEMATMLCFIATDAAVDRAVLASSLQRAAAGSFNMISVDGCMSTNDCILALANGAADGPAIVEGDPRADAFTDALARVCGDLARMIVEDGEGATKVLSIIVEGAATEQDARTAARTVADSVLLRCAVGGGDPNWGRVLAALGTAPVEFDPERTDVWVAGEHLCAQGGVGPGSRARAAENMRERNVEIRIDLHAGAATATMLTNDLTAEYVRINTEYTT